MVFMWILYSFLCIAAVWIWQIVNWAWLQPRRMERYLRRQGLNGNSYRFLVGDSKEIASLYEEAHSTILDPKDDITSRIMPFIEKTMKTYGTNPFAWIGPTPRIIISEPELMRSVLYTHRIFQKNFRATNELLRLVIGGFALKEGDEWKKSRSKFEHAFHMEKLKKMVPLMQQCTQAVLNKWMNKMSEDGSGVVDITQYLEDVSGAMVTRSLFHTPYDDEMKRNYFHLKDMSIMASIASKPFVLPGSEYLPSKKTREAREMDKVVKQSLRNLINKRVKDRNEGIYNEEKDLFDLFLDELYEPVKELSNADREKIVEEAIATFKFFIFAGFDTTANFMAWTMINLSIHQEWQTRAREEIFQIIGDTEIITNDILSQLKIIPMILYEVLRLYPPVMELSRVVEEETQLGNIKIPKGVFIQVPLGLMHRNTDVWGEDAMKFRPDRFADGVLKAANGQMAFMPFSLGSRTCLGQHFAFLEVKTFVAQLLRTFTFDLDPSYKHAPCAAFTIQPQHGAPILLKKL